MEDFNFDPIDGFENPTIFIDKPFNARENVMRLLKQIKDFINSVMKPAIENKVEKAEGKGLSTNDYTNDERSKLAGIEVNANNYTHPTSHPASIIIEEADKKFMTDSEKSKLAGIVEGATKNEIAILEGSYLCTANTQENINQNYTQQTIFNIPFPTGFTRDNCIVAAFLTKWSATGGYFYGEGEEIGRSFAMATGAVSRQIQLGNDVQGQSESLRVFVYNFSPSAKTIYYKIVLMKIA